MESQNKPTNIPQAILCNTGIPVQSQVPSDIPANEYGEMLSSQSQPAPVVTQSLKGFYPHLADLLEYKKHLSDWLGLSEVLSTPEL